MYIHQDTHVHNSFCFFFPNKKVTRISVYITYTYIYACPSVYIYYSFFSRGKRDIVVRSSCCLCCFL